MSTIDLTDTEMAELDRAYAAEQREISDGTHTFGEMYDHRAALLLALMRSHPAMSWRSLHHHDGTMPYPGRFIAGMNLPTGQISYHLSTDPWWSVTDGIVTLECAPEHDGHTTRDVIERLTTWVPTAEPACQVGDRVEWSPERDRVDACRAFGLALTIDDTRDRWLPATVTAISPTSNRVRIVLDENEQPMWVQRGQLRDREEMTP